MASSFGYHKFESKLLEKCSTENSRKYATENMRRFFHTCNLIVKYANTIDQDTITILDVGPFLPFTLTSKEIVQELLFKGCSIGVIELPGSGSPPDSYHDIDVEFINVEQASPIKLIAKSYNIAIVSGIVEHLTSNPVQALKSVHDLLVNRGILILQIPNVASLSQRLKLLLGRNIYDRYSFESVYGRHNREYSAIEVKELAESSGFQILENYTKSPYPRKFKGPIFRRCFIAIWYLLINILISLRINCGEHIFCIAREIKKEPTFPSRLYRNSPGLQSMFK